MSGMPLRLGVAAVLAVLAPCLARAQEQGPPVHVYEAFHRVAFSDLEEWNRIYYEHLVPILEDLRDEGVIEGWGQWQHHTGGEYNVRFVVRTWDWASLGTFWGEYLSRAEATVPASGWDAVLGMIQAHEDEIWNIVEVNVSEDMEIGYLYTASYQFGFGHQEEWDRISTEVVGPMLDDAVDQGLLEGWVRLGHNSGGPHNAKVLYFFAEWDDMDDFFERVPAGLEEEHAADFEALSNMIQAHTDVIWVPAPDPGM